MKINYFTVKFLRSWSPFGSVGEVKKACYWYPEENRAVNDKTDYIHFPDFEYKYSNNCIDADAVQFQDWSYNVK